MGQNYLKSKTFEPFYRDIIQETIVRIKEEKGIEEILTKAAWADMEESLYKIFYQASVRTIIYEMHISREKGMLKGRDSGEEYNSFLEYLEQEKFRKSIFMKYPEIDRYLKVIQTNQVIFWKEVMVRLQTDWEKIRCAFWPKSEKTVIAGIRKNVGDQHSGGKSVIQFLTNKGNVFFYKPRPVTNEIYLQDLLGKIYQSFGWTAYPYPMIAGEGYGWVKEVPYEECRSREEVAGFYRRSGLLAAVSYIMGIGDLHYENMISYRMEPVIIDAESLFQNMDPLYRWTGTQGSFYSVLASGLFPGGIAGGRTAGITGSGQSVYSGKVAVIMNDQTSDMRIEYRRPESKPGKNRVGLQGKHPEMEDFADEIVSGFRKGYNWFLENRENVLSEAALWAETLFCRHIRGGTQFYGMAIQAATHPSLMEKTEDRFSYLYRICKNRDMGKWETEAMMEGDIPLFFRKADDRNLYANHGELAAPGYFNCSILESLKERMHGLSKEDLDLQLRILKFSMDVFGDKKAEWDNCVCEDKAPEREIRKEWLSCAIEIAERISGLRIEQDKNIFWLTIEGEGEKTVVKPADMYFYGGISGIAVFYRKLYLQCGLWGDVCEKLENMMFSYTDRILSREISPMSALTGMYCGESSVAYAYQLLYRSTGDIKYLDYAGKHIRSVEKLLKDDTKYDLLYGNAGAVLVLCQQFEYTGTVGYLDVAEQTLRHLNENKTGGEKGITWLPDSAGSPVCSAAHGNSGIFLAYARMYALQKKKEYLETMHLILKYEDSFFDKNSGNWADLRKGEENRYGTYAWCNAGIGVIWARLQAYGWLPEEKWIADSIRKAEKMLERMPLRKGMCLCHGNMGNYYILEQAQGVFLKQQITQRAKEIKKQLCGGSFTPVLKQENSQAGFMNALAGIGFLYLVNEDTTFSQ